MNFISVCCNSWWQKQVFWLGKEENKVLNIYVFWFVFFALGIESDLEEFAGYTTISTH
jgi:hypothetical protein